MGNEQRGGANERAQRVADHIIYLCHAKGIAVLCVLDSCAENAANKHREDNSNPPVPFLQQGVGQRQPQREEEEHIHQHLAVKLWLLPCGAEGGEGGEDELIVARCTAQDGGVEDNDS